MNEYTLFKIFLSTVANIFPFTEIRGVLPNLYACDSRQQQFFAKIRRLMKLSSRELSYIQEA